MLNELLTFILGCLILTMRTEASCKRWKNHQNFHLIHTEDNCGQKKTGQSVSARILNGRTSSKGSLPWMAFVQTRVGNKTSNCGGSIINEFYILTAAHCVDDDSDFEVEVTLGLYDKQELTSKSVQRYSVEESLKHSGYDRHFLQNDIALLRLDRRISFDSSLINYICLPNSCDVENESFLGKFLSFSGWGFTSDVQRASILQAVALPGKVCPKYKVHNNTVFPIASQLCAGSGDVRGCRGDSGGPLTYQTAGRAVQVGIMSFGSANCTQIPDDLRNIFTKVSSFMDWILTNIRP